MKSLAILSLLIIGAFCSTFHEQVIKDLYQQWKQTYNKPTSTPHEDQHRFNIFSQNYLSILEFNSNEDSVTLGLNQFADLTTEEFEALYTNPSLADKPEHIGEYLTFDESQDPPASLDWRQKGAVTPIKEQGQCGSCWAFSAVGALEGLYFLNNSQLISFSEQNIVDCSDRGDGCLGGWPEYGFMYTAQGGINTEADYPYIARDGDDCYFNASSAIKVNSGYRDVKPNKAAQLKLALVQQPVSITIAAGGLVFQFYKSGVIKHLCGSIPNHAVLAVGWDTFNGDEGLIVKNSWGTKWGQEGYVYISTNPSAHFGAGVCGIYNGPTIPYKN